MANQQTELVFVPLGGVGEIGMNFALYGYGPADRREWMIVDVGVSFPGPDLPGVDLVMPDIEFVASVLPQVRGIVITHAHEDHYGALLDLWPKIGVQLWMSPFAAGMLEAKRVDDKVSLDVPVTIYRAGDKFQVGPFQVEAIPVAHSIPEPFALAITTPAGTIIHTGDWRIDAEPEIGPPTNETRLRQLSDAGVLALVCDSTNAMRDGDSPTEQAVGAGLRGEIEKAPALVAITSFSSNVGRIRLIAEAARDVGREVVVLGRSMKRVIDVASELGYMDGLPPFLDEQEFAGLPRDKIVVLCTGSQGEDRAALAKLSRDEMRTVELAAGDTVIFSSRVIPGNEKPVLGIKNRLIDMGVKVVEDGDALVHVSGHPRRNELRKMYEWTRPRILVPVHGEAAHLVAQGSLGAMAGIPEVVQVRDGDVLRLSPGPAEIIDEAPHGRLYKDGKLLGTEEGIGVKERRKLAFSGHVSVNIVLDERYEMAGDPDLVAIGLPQVDAAGADLEGVLLAATIGAIDSIPRAKRKDLDLVAEAARRAVRNTADKAWGKKPVVTVFVTY